MSETRRVSDERLEALAELAERVGPLQVVKRGDAARTFFVTQATDDTFLHDRYLLQCQDAGSGRDLTQAEHELFISALVDSSRNMRDLVADCRAARQELAALRHERDAFRDNYSRVLEREADSLKREDAVHAIAEAAEARALMLREAIETRDHPSGFAVCKICGGTNINGREWSDIRPGDPITHLGPGAYKVEGCPLATAADAQAWLEDKLAQERERCIDALADVARAQDDPIHGAWRGKAVQAVAACVDAIRALGSGQHSPAREAP